MGSTLQNYLDQMYQFGINKNKTSADELVSRMETVLATSCAPPSTTVGYGNSGINTRQKITNTNLGEKYSAVVEEGNIYINDLLMAESTYFLNKYGVDIYKTLTDARTAYFNTLTIKPVSPDLKYDMILNSLNILSQDEGGNTNAMNILNTYLPSFDSNTIYREIEYRDNEYTQLHQVNFYINLAYYIGFIILLALLYSSNNLLLKERGLIYLFLGILPFIYPWLFLFSRKFFPKVSYNGPTNAFLDTNVTTTTAFSNNQTNDYKKQLDTR